MKKMHDKEKLIKLHFEQMKELEKQRHKNIMEEIKEMGKQKVTSLRRDVVNVKKKK